MRRGWLVLALLAPIAAGACSPGGEEAVVAGTVLDASTGEPIADARVEGPDGSSATSGRDGRFELRLAVGTRGELRVRAPQERSASVALRPLEPGTLEVVLRASAGR